MPHQSPMTVAVRMKSGVNHARDFGEYSKTLFRCLRCQSMHILMENYVSRIYIRVELHRTERDKDFHENLQNVTCTLVPQTLELCYHFVNQCCIR